MSHKPISEIVQLPVGSFSSPIGLLQVKPLHDGEVGCILQFIPREDSPFVAHEWHFYPEETCPTHQQGGAIYYDGYAVGFSAESQLDEGGER